MNCWSFQGVVQVLRRGESPLWKNQVDQCPALGALPPWKLSYRTLGELRERAGQHSDHVEPGGACQTTGPEVPASEAFLAHVLVTGREGPCCLEPGEIRRAGGDGQRRVDSVNETT